MSTLDRRALLTGLLATPIAVAAPSVAALGESPIVTLVFDLAAGPDRSGVLVADKTYHVVWRLIGSDELVP